MKKLLLAVLLVTSTAVSAQSLQYISRYRYQYPSDVGLIRGNNDLSQRIAKIAGRDRLRVFQQLFAVQGTVYVQSKDYFKFSGCEAHNCNTTNFLVYYDLKTDKLYFGYRVEGDVELFGDDYNYPPDLVEFKRYNKVF